MERTGAAGVARPRATLGEAGPRVRLAGASPWAVVAVVVTVISWAAAFAGIRVAVQSYEPAHVALLRYLIASAALGVYAVYKRMPLPARRDVPGLAVTGLIGIAFYNVALSYAQVTIPAGTASFLVASAPVFVALLARFFLRERLFAWGWAGIGTSFAGVAVIALGTGQGLQIDARAVVVLAAAFASALFVLGQKPYLRRYSVLQCTAYAIWAGTLFLLPFGAGLLEEVTSAPFAATAWVVFLGMVPGALGYLAWGYVLARVPASVAGSFLYLIPAVAVLIAWVLLGEIPTLASIAGGVLVVGGVILVNTRGR